VALGQSSNLIALPPGFKGSPPTAVPLESEWRKVQLHHPVRRAKSFHRGFWRRRRELGGFSD
jgi:hypothetical protein